MENLDELLMYPPDEEEALEIQTRWAERVRLIEEGDDYSPLSPANPVYTVAGLDISYRDDGMASATAVLWDIEFKGVMEYKTVTGKVDFPYIPGLLAFREAYLMSQAIRLLELFRFLFHKYLPVVPILPLKNPHHF